MKLSFLGAAGEVTGSNYLLESGDTKILIDCGLAQGGRFAEEKNFEPLPFNPKEITSVLVTHAHIDHIGRIPQLYREGFTGDIYSTPPTRDFAELLLLDSEHILGKVAADIGREPLYMEEDIEGVMELWQGRRYRELFEIGPFKIEFFDAGHILGSAFIRIEAEGKSVVFSGDLGNYPAPIVKDTEALPQADYVIMESTYGGRVHESAATREEELKEAIVHTVKRGGVIMIPAFAMERTQELLFHLNKLVENGLIPRLPIFMDSPLAIKLTTVYGKYKRYFDEEASQHIQEGDEIFEFPGLHLTLTTEESKAINEVPAPKMIIAGSGMSNGGRILHHEYRYISDPKNTLLLVGYQARGTLGRRLQDGVSPVRIYGEEIPVRCEVKSLTAFSAHADQPLLIHWIKAQSKSIKKVFLTHGELEQAEVLRDKIKSDLGLEVEIPGPMQSVEL